MGAHARSARWNARQHEIAQLPLEMLSFLTASRYCKPDVLSQPAWDLFGTMISKLSGALIERSGDPGKT